MNVNGYEIPVPDKAVKIRQLFTAFQGKKQVTHLELQMILYGQNTIKTYVNTNKLLVSARAIGRRGNPNVHWLRAITRFGGIYQLTTTEEELSRRKHELNHHAQEEKPREQRQWLWKERHETIVKQIYQLTGAR